MELFMSAIGMSDQQLSKHPDTYDHVSLESLPDGLPEVRRR